MNKTFVLGLIFAGAVISTFVRAEEQKPAAAQQEQPVEVNNKICPVSHEEVDKDGMVPHKVTYKGKIYNLCCGMCEKDFNKDPAKYVQMIEDQMKSETVKSN